MVVKSLNFERFDSVSEIRQIDAFGERSENLEKSEPLFSTVYRDKKVINPANISWPA